MSYTLPSLRARRTSIRHSSFVIPLAAPEIVAATRLVVCECCEHNSGDRCRLFGCCEKKISQFVTLATRTCPAKRWTAWLPAKN